MQILELRTGKILHGTIEQRYMRKIRTHQCVTLTVNLSAHPYLASRILYTITLHYIHHMVDCLFFIEKSECVSVQITAFIESGYIYPALSPMCKNQRVTAAQRGQLNHLDMLVHDRRSWYRHLEGRYNMFVGGKYCGGR